MKCKFEAGYRAGNQISTGFSRSDSDKRFEGLNFAIRLINPEKSLVAMIRSTDAANASERSFRAMPRYRVDSTSYARP
jgi:hypothetical protein